MKKIVLLFFMFFLAIFDPVTAQTPSDKPKYYILISIEDCKLWLYQIENDKSLKLLKEYPVSTVRKNIRHFPLGKGQITAIEFNPSWHPTQKTLKEFAKKGIALPKNIPPKHPLNYMGSFKMHLSHQVKNKGMIYRIHGIRKSERHQIGRRISGGCVRMLNEDGEEIARLVPIGTEVNIIMKKLAGSSASF